MGGGGGGLGRGDRERERLIFPVSEVSRMRGIVLLCY